jgi:hypothetical protein
MRQPVFLKAEGLMLAAKEAIDKRESEQAIKYLEAALEEVRTHAAAQG